jgi:hypothetical protein
MTLRNLLIAGFTATSLLALTATFFLGFSIWLSSTGIGLCLAIVTISFSGAGLSLSRRHAENESSPSLPGWVRVWQRIGVLLAVLLLLIYGFQYAHSA